MPLKSQLFNTILNEVTKGVQNLQHGRNDNSGQQPGGGSTYGGGSSGYGGNYEPQVNNPGNPSGGYSPQVVYPNQPSGYPNQPGGYPSFQGSYPGQPQGGYPGYPSGPVGYPHQGPGMYPGQMNDGHRIPGPDHRNPPAIGFRTPEPYANASVYPQIGFNIPRTPNVEMFSNPSSTPLSGFSNNLNCEFDRNPVQPNYPSVRNARDNPVFELSNSNSATFGTGCGQNMPIGAYGQYGSSQHFFSRSHLGMQGTPTIRPYQAFNPNGDAETLRKAMKGFGCDKNKVINVLCARVNFQRQQIAAAYKTLYGKDLINDLKSELSGDFEDLILALMEPPARYDAQQLYKAMEGLGTKESVLIEIMCSRTNAQIVELRNVYQQMYGRNLETDLIGETSGHFKRLLVSLCTGGRDESMQTDPLRANQDAKKLYKSGEQRLGTDESCFNAILASQNYAQLRLVFQEYQKITNHTIEKAIEAEFSGDIKDGLLAVVACAQNKPAYFATLLYKSMAGLGTRDNDLIRVIVTRAEVDLADVREEFERIYKKSLESFIKGDCSGAYKDGLIALVRGN